MSVVQGDGWPQWEIRSILDEGGCLFHHASEWVHILMLSKKLLLFLVDTSSGRNLPLFIRPVNIDVLRWSFVHVHLCVVLGEGRSGWKLDQFLLYWLNIEAHLRHLI